MAKHINIKHYNIKNHVENCDCLLGSVDLENQLTDIFTKPLLEEKFNLLRNLLEILYFLHNFMAFINSFYCYFCFLYIFLTMTIYFFPVQCVHHYSLLFPLLHKIFSLHLFVLPLMNFLNRLNTSSPFSLPYLYFSLFSSPHSHYA